MLRYARAAGIPVDSAIDTGLLRITDKEAAKDKRDAFTPDDIAALFWTSYLNADGDRGPLWWIAHLAAYTGARREELAGLDCGDIERRDGIAGIVIHNNEHRGIKTGQSARFIPFHPHLIEMGLVDYAAERRAGILFPLKRKSRLSTLGDSIDYRWRKAMREAGIPADGKKTFHSFRYYAVQTLIDKEVTHSLYVHVLPK
ncbi:MAG: tyrosine-type recombinase/integrase [Paracoccus sp. (in: a-proteobacteria)]|uniref:tyrosine-type recombinase/integrase n=1 Tax=Paracoccus sp. TaxID=267 RepID=UPI0026E0085E|nr:tyrosine-type recombinase/integrase [Paracoccus sp. (in: a-proteobacteria)]MDO5633155.1 tyrosine-type recombinase/integrase [Paracoccus sp. (in: a-proteobacteria)]